MSELEQLSAEIAKCARMGVKNKRVYPKQLRDKIIDASLKHGRKKVVAATGIGQSLITMWKSRYSYPKKKKIKAEVRPIIINELPKKLSSTIFSSDDNNHNGRPLMRLISPHGHQLELSSYTNQDLIYIVNIFIGDNK